MPITPAPTVTPVTGFTPQFNMNQGGIDASCTCLQSKSVLVDLNQSQCNVLQSSLGYNEDMEEFDKFLEDNPDKKEKMDNYTETAKQNG